MFSPPNVGTLDGVTLTLNKKPLPHFSAFDLLGWVMSKAVGTIPRGATRQNFYLPLLTLYAHWCAVIREPLQVNVGMVAISWFGEALILGSTIPTEPETGSRTKVQQARLKELNKQPSTGKNLTNHAEERGQQFGHCAETNQYLLYTRV